MLGTVDGPTTVRANAGGEKVSSGGGTPAEAGMRGAERGGGSGGGSAKHAPRRLQRIPPGGERRAAPASGSASRSRAAPQDPSRLSFYPGLVNIFSNKIRPSRCRRRWISPFGKLNFLDIYLIIHASYGFTNYNLYEINEV